MIECFTSHDRALRSVVCESPLVPRSLSACYPARRGPSNFQSDRPAADFLKRIRRKSWCTGDYCWVRHYCAAIPL